jgi:hypothetical protein
MPLWSLRKSLVKRTSSTVRFRAPKHLLRYIFKCTETVQYSSSRFEILQLIGFAIICIYLFSLCLLSYHCCCDIISHGKFIKSR